jgi:hypothetical protein
MGDEDVWVARAASEAVETEEGEADEPCFNGISSSTAWLPMTVVR